MRSLTLSGELAGYDLESLCKLGVGTEVTALDESHSHSFTVRSLELRRDDRPSAPVVQSVTYSGFYVSDFAYVVYDFVAVNKTSILEIV